MPAASDIALTGRRVSPKEALELRLIHSIAKSPDSVLAETLEKAKQIAAMSPDGTVVTRAGLRETWEVASIEQAFRNVHEIYFEKLMKGQNSAEGLAAFREKRKPDWKASKL
jgi:enoyl-CoA hydratase/carnithine racemase